MTSPATIRQTTCAVALLLCCAIAAGAQGRAVPGPSAGRIDSVPLCAGHRAVVTYDPAVPGALFTLRDSVRANIWVGYADSVAPAMWRCCITTVMRRVGDVFVASIMVPAAAASVSARFTAGRLEDPRANVSAMVFNAAGAPVRGAYLRARGGGLTFAERVRRELTAFPDEYAVYADKWTYVIAKADRDSVVRADLRTLVPLAARPLPPDGLLYALEYGSMILADEPAGRAAIKRMAALYPRSGRTGDAVLDYQRRVYASQMTGDGPDEVEAIKWELIRKDPGSSLAELVLSENASDPTIPQATFEPVARLWIHGRPDDPRGHLYLAEVLDAHGARSVAARAEADSALMLLFRPRPPLPRDVRRYLPDAYRVAASLALRAGSPSTALADIRAMQTFEQEPSPEPYLFDAGIWSRTGNTPEAERSWIVAWQRGSAIADDSLKALYRRSHVSLDGYPAYVAAKSDSVASLGASRPIAPEVRMVSLAGDSLNARTLAGKVVVLNFWYVGCIPCRVEMPSLNRLVADYQGRDVAFIAVAWDDPDALKTFLAKSAFAYQVVPNGKPIASDFGASLYPTHMVIGKDGRTDLRLVGEDSTHVPLLRLLIDRALNRK